MKHLVEVVRELKKKEERNFVRKTRLTTCGLMPYRFRIFFYRSCHWCHLDDESQQSCYN